MVARIFDKCEQIHYQCVWYPASARLKFTENQSFPVMHYKQRQAQHMCRMYTLS